MVEKSEGIFSFSFFCGYNLRLLQGIRLTLVRAFVNVYRKLMRIGIEMVRAC